MAFYFVHIMGKISFKYFFKLFALEYTPWFIIKRGGIRDEY